MAWPKSRWQPLQERGRIPSTPSSKEAGKHPPAPSLDRPLMPALAPSMSSAPPLPSLVLHCFGHPALTVDGKPTGLSLKHGFALLALLAHAHAPVPRSHLAGVLWPDADDATARTRLRRLAYRIENSATRPVFEGSGELLGLRSGTLAVDLLVFARNARALVGLPSAGTTASDEAFDEALEVAFKPLMHGVDLGSPAFDEWLRARVLEHEHQLLRVLSHRIDALRLAGQTRAALHWAQRLIALDRYCETSYVTLMRLHASEGNRIGVDATFMRCAQELRDEFGGKPSPATERAYLALMEEVATRDAIDSQADATLPVRFAESLQDAVAYAVIGQAEEAVVIIPGFISHIEIGWEQPELRDFLLTLAATHRVLVFDRRGMGLSERVGAVCSADASVTDIISILDHAGIAKAWLFGSSEGGPIALKLAARHPDRVRGVMLMGAMAKGSSSQDYPWALPPAAFDGWMEKMQAGWGGPADIEMFAPSAMHDPRMRAWWARMLRHATSPAGMRATLQALRDVDVRADLARIVAPTLVMHRNGDRAVRPQAGRYLAESIPGARWCPMEGDDHWWWCGDRGSVLRHMQAFLEGHSH